MRNLFLLIFFSLSVFVYSQEKALKSSLLVETLLQGKKMTFTSEVHYSPVNGRLIQHFLSPKEYYIISNSKGEAQIYTPDSNKVTLKSGEVMNSEKSIFGIFMGSSKRDLGLTDLGYGITNVRYENQYEVSEWRKVYDTETSPVDKIELVHENFLPVYMAYFNKDGKALKKVYYYNFNTYSNFNIPSKITEITYINDADSVVSRTTISNLKFIDLNDTDLNFTIPENAKIVQ